MPSGIYNHYKIRGVPKTKEHNLKNRIAHLGKPMPKGFQDGEKNHRWSGNNVSYKALHSWVKNHKGKPIECEFCGNIFVKRGQIHWANKSGRYLRDLSDWLRLCVRCHKKYDKMRKSIK